MRKQQNQTGKKESSVPIIVLAVIIILVLGLSVFLGIKGMGFGGKTKTLVSQEEIDKAKAKERAAMSEDQDVYVTAFKEDVTLSPGQAPQVAANTGQASGTATSGEYIFPNSDSTYLTESEVSGLSKNDLRLARNEILARHGRIFESDDLKTYFESKSWYSGTVDPTTFDANMDSRLSDVERANIEMIKKYE